MYLRCSLLVVGLVVDLVSLLQDDAKCQTEPQDSSVQCRWIEVEAVRLRARKGTGGETSFGRLMRTSSGQELNSISVGFSQSRSSVKSVFFTNTPSRVHMSSI